MYFVISYILSVYERFFVGFANTIVHGDALPKLQELDTESVDCIVTDPPYGYSFMNKDWDKAVVSVETWKECLRVMKHGAFAFIMSSPRQDVLCKMILNLIDAGFETNFTSMYHTYASGFPKAANTSKLLQKRGKEKEELNGSYLGFQPKPALEVILTVMKPLSESSYVDQALSNQKGITWLDDCRIPFQNEKDIGNPDRFKGYKILPPEKGWNQNEVISNGTIGEKGRFPANLIVSDDSLNDGKITGAGITGSGTTRRKNLSPSRNKNWLYGKYDRNNEYPDISYKDIGSHSRYFDLDAWYKKNKKEGRFPANLIVSDDSLNDGTITKSHINSFEDKFDGGKTHSNFGGLGHKQHKNSNSYPDSGSHSRYFDIDKWFAQFLVIPKASASERNKGLENEPIRKRQGVRPNHPDSTDKFPCCDFRETKNNHPTVKPLKLMSYLITMGSRENDLILDPFCGSGTTCIAATMLNRKYIGIELNEEYVEIANKRLAPYLIQNKLTDY